MMGCSQVQGLYIVMYMYWSAQLFLKIHLHSLKNVLKIVPFLSLVWQNDRARPPLVTKWVGVFFSISDSSSPPHKWAGHYSLTYATCFEGRVTSLQYQTLSMFLSSRSLEVLFVFDLLQRIPHVLTSVLTQTNRYP